MINLNITKFVRSRPKGILSHIIATLVKNDCNLASLELQVFPKLYQFIVKAK